MCRRDSRALLARHVEGNALATSAFSEQEHTLGIAAKARYVLLNPAQSGLLILKAQIPKTGDRCWLHPTKRAKPVIC